MGVVIFGKSRALAAGLLLTGVSVHCQAAAMQDSPAHSNRLAKEKSPYLLQHAANPVDWLPWGPEAFEKARREDKPVFLSIGYSTCHWCHVMERESFEKEDTARILNAHFVPVKVDREERPDVDRVYMTFVQATTGGGGWPMSVFLTPDLKPFIGGTYFPPEDRHGRPGFKTVLHRIAEAWEKDRARLVAQGDQMIEALRSWSAPSPRDGGSDLDDKPIRACFGQLEGSFDREHGGFGSAPKFPRPVLLNFLLRHHVREKSQAALDMALRTLDKMAAGGMHDQIGGGFHRYSVDRYWHVPHYEKMLYDQAQLAVSYVEAFQITRNPHYEIVARDILGYVLRDMTDKDGGFNSAEDADSCPSHNTSHPERSEASVASETESKDPATNAKGNLRDSSTALRCARNDTHIEKHEGAFYVWTKDEILAALGAEAAEIFNRHYGVETAGNSPPESDPLGELEGKNTLIERHSIAQTAKICGKSVEETKRSLEASRRKLFDIRERRPRPHRDDKIITAWNGLMISAFAKAAAAFDEPRYLDAATRAAQFVTTHLVGRDSGGTLSSMSGAALRRDIEDNVPPGCDYVVRRSYREGAGSVAGFADDYAFLTQGLLDLYEAGFDIQWLRHAAGLQRRLDAQFFDSKNGGYFSTSGADPSILLRMKEDNDGAEPSPNSIAALNLLRLAQILDDDAMRQRAGETIRAFARQLEQMPTALPQLLVALEASRAKPRQIVIAGKPGAADTQALLREVRSRFLPNTTVLLADGGEGQKWLGEKLEFIRAVAPVDGRAAAYVCENHACGLPLADPAELRALLQR
jgi:hypothetical protein